MHLVAPPACSHTHPSSLYPHLTPPPIRPLHKALTDRALAVVKRTGGGGLAFGPLPPDHPAARTDHSGSVLSLLAAIFSVHPRLWLVPDAGYAGAESRLAVEAAISRTVVHDAMRVSPEVRVPFLEMMAALAVGEYGAAQVLRQFAEMGRTPALEVLTWRKLFAAVVEYCVRYATVLAEVGGCRCVWGVFFGVKQAPLYCCYRLVQPGDHDA